MKMLLERIATTIKKFWKQKHITQILLLSFLLFIFITIVFFAFTASRANVQSLKEGLEQSTTIFDKDGNEAAALATNRTEGVSINDVPKHVKDAVIAIEDRRFYEHNGFDLKGMGRAFFDNLFAGRITGGGSTITQQLTKIALLSPEKTYRRKIEELFLAVEIEKTYKKDEILEMYLNQAYFGGGAWGIDHAARKYFNKSIQDVTLSEAALLAGLLQAPTALSPFEHYDKALLRRNVVLKQMHEQKKITKEEYEAAKSEEIALEDGGGTLEKRKYPYYVDAVLDEATSKYGLTQEDILTRGYRIYTEMDQNIQSAMENVYSTDAIFPKGKNGTLVQSGAVLLDPDSGGVRGVVGGRGEHVFRGFNRATHLKVQPGSTMKPLAVYVPALEEGYEFTSELVDEPMSFGDYTPENYTATYQGKVKMYEAVEQSLNVPAVWLLNEIGLEKGIDSLQKFGIPLEKEDAYLGIALGGMRKGISPLQLADAYAAFANEGRRMEGHFITKIVSPTGETIFERESTETKVTTKAVADEMTAMLLNVVETGTGKSAQIPGYQIAGKTGSTQLPFQDLQGTKDQWFVGYTPNLVGAVWLGYDKTDREHYLTGTSSNNVVPIFRDLMEQALPHTAQEDFTVESINKRLVDEQEQEQSFEEKMNEAKEKIAEESGKLKEKWEEGMKEINELGKKIKDKWNEIFGN
ncbi:PBP1A family penicillin-binding protein [Bacillaceae bacterium Marseille-Q3522]|nr:PBP1A family penicillin-binding protein [Bacillaceae bacterium Marseille-Q3522]